MTVMTKMVNISWRMNTLLLLDHVLWGCTGFAGFAGFAGFTGLAGFAGLAKKWPGKRHGPPDIDRQGSP